MRIPRPVLALLALPLTLFVTGCFSSYTLVKVKPDGTGTVEQTTMVSQMMMGMMAGMASGMAGEKDAKKSKPPSVADMFKEDELRAAATKMGTGVRYVSSKPAKGDGKEGVTAIYAFDDVTKLSVSQNMKGPGSSGGDDGPIESPIAFSLAPAAGGSKVLSIRMPEKDKAAMKAAKKEQTADGPPDMKDVPPEMLAMMKGMFQGAKIGIDVEVAGTLIKSNSPYVSGSRVTLMEVDLGALMEDPTKFQKLQELGPGASFDEARKVLGDVKGIKLPPAAITTIEWR